MFGSSSSSPKDATIEERAESSSPSSDRKSLLVDSIASPTRDSRREGSKRERVGKTCCNKRDEPAVETKRRISGVSRASALFTSAKNSLHLSHSHSSSNDTSTLQTPLQKLSKIDPALSVPQGALNNSAGDSLPGPRSSFKVGVTEDRNKKCRRTMEDTHAYLYNFLGTPAPLISDEPKASPKSISPGSPKSLESSKRPTSTELASDFTHVVETDNGYFAIFDGHAGTFAAEWCGKKLHVLLEEAIRKNPNTPIPELLDQTFTTVDQNLEKLPLKNSGCTAICAVLRWEDRIPYANSATGSTPIAPVAAAVTKSLSQDAPIDPHLQGVAPQVEPALSALPKLQESASRQRVLYTANVGDARIILCRSGKALRLSYDHKGSDENEGRRIANAGGLILNNRVNGVLAVTRALGDSYMKDLVTGHPYTTATVIQPDMDEFLILACDGLWDVYSDQEAVDLIRDISDPQYASKVLVDHALSRFSTDNITVMVVRFDTSKIIQNSLDEQIGPIGVEGDPPSIKQGGVSETDHLVAKAKKATHINVPVAELSASDRESIIKTELEKEPGPELMPPLRTSIPFVADETTL